MAEEGSAPQRPEIIDHILGIKDQINNRDVNQYKTFLKAVEEAQQQASTNGSVCNITLGYHSISNEHIKPAENSALRIAFDFYAKLQTPGQQLATSNVTYELMRFANETLSFHELAVWMRDFLVVPSLLTKGELRFLWKMTSLQWVRMGKDQIKYLTFEMFQDFFARMAILAYNKPGMRRLILNTNGTMPSASDLVETLCHYMHLDDFAWVKERLNTTGRESVRNHNFRSVGERNESSKTELRDDVKGSRFAQLMTSNDDEDILIEEKKHVEDHIHGHHHGRAAKHATGGEEADEEAARELAQEEAQEEAERKNKKAHRVHLAHDSETDMAAKIAEAMQKKISGITNTNTIEEDKEREEREKDGRAVKALTAGNNSLRISSAQEEALLNYDPQLSKLLEKYSLKQQRLDHQNEDSFSGGAFIDLGCQRVGRNLVTSVTIVNCSIHEMQIDVVARGFPSDTKVTLLAKSFAPGLRRDANVQFTVSDSPDGGSVMGFIDVHAVPVRGCAGDQPILQSCPVFYRPTHHDSPITELPVCNMRNLPILLEKYNLSYTPLTVEFEKMREWYSGPSWRVGPAPGGVNYATGTPAIPAISGPENVRMGTISPKSTKSPKSRAGKSPTKKSNSSAKALQSSKLPTLTGIGADAQEERIKVPGCFRGLRRDIVQTEMNDILSKSQKLADPF